MGWKYHSLGQFLNAFELYMVNGFLISIEINPKIAIVVSLIIPGMKNPEALPWSLARSSAIADPTNP